ncbi:hypothetical protein SSCG_01952 [Streptomyces clavuligerus]|nr:hypothetical protein SSCG_01952 [Streptomyces clavuligerus]
MIGTPVHPQARARCPRTGAALLPGSTDAARVDGCLQVIEYGPDGPE